MMQYFYANKDCRAVFSSSADCICWHDKGTGPGINERGEDKTEGMVVRKKPVKIITKHEKALRDIRRELAVSCGHNRHAAAFEIARKALDE